MVRQFFRELFARENADMTLDATDEAAAGEHPPSLYDTLIDSLDGDLVGLTTLRDYHARKVETLDLTIQHKRAQRTLLAMHRVEERHHDRYAPLTNAGGWNGVAFIDAHGRQYSAAEFDRAVACGAIAIDR